MRLKFKNTVLFIWRMLHSFFKLNKLSLEETKGSLAQLTKLKLSMRSFHNLPFSQGLSVRGAKFGDVDPFCRALVGVNTVLDEKHFSNVILPKLIEERSMLVRDFLPSGSGFAFSNYPLYSMAFPWDSHTFDTFKHSYLGMVLDNRREHIQDPTQTLNTDFIYSEKYLASHINQFNNLLASIKNSGFDTRYSRPRVLILRAGTRWKWMMSGQGNHRAYLLWALNYTDLPCEIVKVVDRDDIDNWPNVKNGIYSSSHAREIFDLTFSGSAVLRGIV